MTKEEAIEYCYSYKNEFISKMQTCGENGQRQFDCLIEILENGSIQPKDLPVYGMDYEPINQIMYKEFRKIATVKAKLFEKGDEDGFIHRSDILGAIEDTKFGFKPDLVPYIAPLENQYYRGEFGEHYLCLGINMEKWLVDKTIFERTYEAIK